MLAFLYNELAGTKQSPHTNPHQSFSSLPNQLPDSYQEFVPVRATTPTNNGTLVGTTSTQLEPTHELTSNFSPSPNIATDFSDFLSNTPDTFQYPYQPLTPESVRMSPTGFMSDSELDKFLLEFESDNGDTGFDLDSFIDL